ncbi:MAG: hypothetical protein QM683_23280, partial [Lacrimispora sp.]
MELSGLQQVYGKLGDDLSKEIYKYRVMFSVSQEEQWNTKLARTNEVFMQFISLLQKYPGQVVVMGAGYRGKQLVHLNQDIQWKCFIDKEPKTDAYEGIPVQKTVDFLKNYGGEIIVIASRIYESEMHNQLRESGISENHIISYGNILEKLRHDQYFDLPAMVNYAYILLFRKAINLIKKEIFTAGIPDRQLVCVVPACFSGRCINTVISCQ